ncbi:hypothetical protein LINPERHAP1_LOCUS13868 [Linum perenne]
MFSKTFDSLDQILYVEFLPLESRLLGVVSSLSLGELIQVGVVSTVMSDLDLRQMILCFLETCFQLNFAQVFRAQLLSYVFMITSFI